MGLIQLCQSEMGLGPLPAETEIPRLASPPRYPAWPWSGSVNSLMLRSKSFAQRAARGLCAQALRHMVIAGHQCSPFALRHHYVNADTRFAVSRRRRRSKRRTFGAWGSLYGNPYVGLRPA